jgi:hypothetical protein
MIKFKCVYCGQKILTKDDGAGKKGKCPKCAHLLTVPASTKGRPAISVEKTEPITQQKEYVPEWAKEEPSPTYIIGADDSVELFREHLGFLVPTYDSLSVFLMAITWILVILTHPKTQTGFLTLMDSFPTQHYSLNILIADLVFTAVIVFCFYMVLSKRYKSDAEKMVMAVFAAITTVITAYVYWSYLKTSHLILDWTIIFPLWNIFNARMLLYMLRTGVINQDCVSDRQASPIQVFLGLITVVAIFLVCNYRYEMHWSITFSICVAYTTSFDRAIQNIFPGWMSQREEEPEA